jgi:DNA (cytosine-5)-methyltransferase 1
MKEFILTKKLTFGSLFAGIGGMDLGLERAGMECRWQVEIDPFCQKVLAKHWPNVKRYGDIKNVDGRELEPADLICGGFPCQDLSRANNNNAIGRRGITDNSRSGLWSEYFRLVCEKRPRYILVENVSALLQLDDSRNSPIGRVLSDLASIRYDAEWSVFRACEVGASHPRARVFILAYPQSDGLEGSTAKTISRPKTDNQWNHGQLGSVCGKAVFCPESTERALVSEPEIVGLTNGVSRQLGELKGYGNAVVPQVAEWIGRRIVAHENRLSLTGAPLPAYPVLEGGGLIIHRAETLKAGEGASSPDPVLRTQGSECR